MNVPSKPPSYNCTVLALLINKDVDEQIEKLYVGCCFFFVASPADFYFIKCGEKCC